MSDDHLSQETSISAELTETGVKAAAKSRTVASIDRLVGNAFDVGSAFLEGVTARKRAKNEGERQLIDAAVKHGLARLQSDDAFANRAFENHFKKIVQQQINKDAVAAEALEDLHLTPPTEEEATSGADTISEEFLSRFESYAEGATTKQLRQRWGRILASEIRRPGTFSPKVLRATDELDAEAASLFESLMPYRVRDILIACIMPQLTFEQKLLLVEGGLIVDPGFVGHRNTFGGGTFDGEEVWATPFGDLLITFPKSTEITGSRIDVVSRGNESADFGVFILTDVGKALSGILPSQEEALGREYAMKLQHALPHAVVKIWLEVSNGLYRPIAFPA